MPSLNNCSSNIALKSFFMAIFALDIYARARARIVAGLSLNRLQ